MAHQNHVGVEVKESHFVICLVGGPMLLRHSVCGDHDAGAIVTVVAVHEYFLFRIVAKQLQKTGHLVVARAKESAGGKTDVTHSEALDDNSLGSVRARVPQINNDVDSEIFQLLIPEVARLSAAIQRIADLARIGNAPQFQFFAERQNRSRVGRRNRDFLRIAILRSKTTEQQNKRKDRDAARTKWKRNARGDQIIPFREEKLDICKAITSLRVFESACSRNFCGRMPN